MRHAKENKDTQVVVLTTITHRSWISVHGGVAAHTRRSPPHLISHGRFGLASVLGWHFPAWAQPRDRSHQVVIARVVSVAWRPWLPSARCLLRSARCGAPGAGWWLGRGDAHRQSLRVGMRWPTWHWHTQWWHSLGGWTVGSPRQRAHGRDRR
jgi:hypothetical protein